MGKTRAVKTRTKRVSLANGVILALAMALLLVAIAALYLPSLPVRPEHALAASMLLGMGGAIQHFLAPMVEITVLELRSDRLWFRSHKNPINGFALCSSYSSADTILLADIEAIQLRTVEVPKVGSFGLVVLQRQNGLTTTIWFDRALYPAVDRLVRFVHASQDTIRLEVVSDG